MEERTDLDIIDALVNMYMASSEIKHLGLLCQRASYKNDQVLCYIRKMRDKYNI